MKTFKVQIQDNKAEFFKELLTQLGVTDFEELTDYHEPRIYPGANFEIQVRGKRSMIQERKKIPQEMSKDAGMESIRAVLSKIEKQRDKNRK